MRNHLTLKEIAAALGVRETYAGQAFDPAMRKVAAVLLRHPIETLRMIADEADKLRRKHTSGAERVDAGFDGNRDGWLGSG